MTEIRVPASVSDIAPDAFDGHSSALVLYVTADSPAHTYAQQHGLRFVKEGSGDIILPPV